MKKVTAVFAAIMLGGAFSASAGTPGEADSSGGAYKINPGLSAESDKVTMVSSGAEDFLFFKEEAVVMLASRLASREESHVAAEVITAEEIRASGALNFWDVLRFRAGMDVIEVRLPVGNRAMVSVRGFPQIFVGNLQVIVDGRSVYSEMAGGVLWEQISVQLQDIERIEIVRGPNSALYGSNAGLGVINIITKKADGKTAVELAGTGGSRSTFGSAVALQGQGERADYRLSHSYLTTAGLKRESAGGDPLRSNNANFRGGWEIKEGDALEVAAGSSADNAGSVVTGINESRQNFQTVKFTSRLGEASSIEATASRSELASESVSSNLGGSVREIQYAGEAFHRFKWGGGRLNTSWGVGYRNATATGFIFSGAPFNNTIRLFAQQLVKFSQKLSFVGAASLEKSRVGGAQENYQGALLLNPSRDHTFRLSYSKSATIPNLLSVVGNLVGMLGNPDLKSQQLRSCEIGYGGSYLRKTLNIDASLFYMTIDDLNSIGSGGPPPGGPPPGGPPAAVSWNNSNGARARGAEFSMKYKPGTEKTMYINYTYEYIRDERGDVNVRKGTPRNKLNLGFMTALKGGFSFSASAGYKDVYTVQDMITGSGRIPAYWRLDSRLAYAIGAGSELFVSGQNLLRAVHREYADSFEVPRVFYAGVSAAF